MRYHQQILTELCELKNTRTQKVWGLFNSATVFELYNFEYKKLYLILDTSKQNTTFHVQNFVIKNTKTSHPIILALKKYALGKNIRIISQDSECQKVLILFSQDKNNLLVCDFFPNLKLSYYVQKKLIATTSQKNPPEFPTDINLGFDYKNTSLKYNFLQAKTYQKNLSTVIKDVQINYILNNLIKKIKKTKKLLKNLGLDLSKCESVLQNIHQAELLKSNLRNISRGDKFILVTNYFSEIPKEEKISLDPVLSPQENLEKLFKNIKKAQRGKKIILLRIQEAELKLYNLKQNIIKIESGENLEILNLTDKIINKNKIKKTKHVPYREYKSQNNIKILVGKSAKDSDILISKFCSGNNWWFHVRDAQGTHVIAKTSLLDQELLLDCCLLAAWFSKLRGDPKPVIQYTQIKNLRKPKGLPPGKVIISQEKTREIMIDRGRQARLLSQETQS